MVEEIRIWASWGLGLNEDDLGIMHMSIRAVVVFAFALALVRLGKKRFISENTAFDVLLGVMLGSIISRAITGQSPFVPTLIAAMVLVALHWFFAQIAVRSDLFGTMIKGSTRILVSDGTVDWDAMKRSNLSRNDLLEAVRLKAGSADWKNVKEARLERNGEISVILNEH